MFGQLVAEADVFIQNFRPGVATRLNVAAERLQGIKPELIYAAISGFGQEGPDRDRPAFDTAAQAASGFLRLLVNPAHPRVVGPAIADAMTGFYTAYGILAALHERHATGRGPLVETSMFEAMSHFNLDDLTHYFSEGMIMGPSSRPHVSQSYVFECADGKWVALHMSSPPKFWENLAAAVGQPDMLSIPAFETRDARIAHYEDVIAFLAPIFATRTRERPSMWMEASRQRVRSETITPASTGDRPIERKYACCRTTAMIKDTERRSDMSGWKPRSAEHLLDRIQIEDLIVLYYNDLVAEDRSSLSSHFTEDGIFDINGKIMRDRAEIDTLYAGRGLARRSGHDRQVQHDFHQFENYSGG